MIFQVNYSETKIVTLIINFVAVVTNFVTNITNFVTKINKKKRLKDNICYLYDIYWLFVYVYCLVWVFVSFLLHCWFVWCFVWLFFFFVTFFVTEWSFIVTGMAEFEFDVFEFYSYIFWYDVLLLFMLLFFTLKYSIRYLFVSIMFFYLCHNLTPTLVHERFRRQ